MRPPLGVTAAALICYILALGGAGAFAVRLFLLGLDLFPPPSLVPSPWPWVVDLGWLLLFGLQHTGMARDRFKRLWTRVVPPHLERSLYAAASGLLLLGLSLTWQPLPGAAWWRLHPLTVVVPLAAGLGLALVNLRFDHTGLFGLRQAWEHGREPAPERLLVVGPYRYVRHPLMACLLVLLWAQPVMMPTLALLSGGLTAYILVGLWFEERDLLARFGPAYAAYRRRVPALLPWRSPVPAATHLAAGVQDSYRFLV